MVRQVVGRGGKSCSHFSDELLQVLLTEHETKTWRVKMTEAETSKGHHNPFYPSFLLKEPHFVGEHVPRLLADVGDPWDTLVANEMTMEVQVALLGKLLKRRAGSASSSPSSYLESR